MQSVTRTPGFRMTANNVPITSGISVEVEANNNYGCDSVSGTVALTNSTTPLSWWTSQTDIMLAVEMGIDDGWQNVITAKLDHLEFDLVGNCVRFNGRNLVGILMDTKTQKAYPNQTSAEIVQAIGAEHGMTVVATPTKTLVGQYYQLQHEKITLNNLSHQTTEWDLLTYLAQEEEFNIWVQGNTLYFQPPSANTTPPFQIIYTPPNGHTAYPTLNVESVTMERSLTLAKDIQVTVKSTNLRNGAVYHKTVQAIGAAHNPATMQKYVFTKPGLTPDQAFKHANAMLSDLSKHELVLRIEMPGELTLTPRSMIQFSGTGTVFDTTYFVAEIERSISFDEGFTQSARCKNTSTRTILSGP